jgi:hypothetical protein
MLRHLAMLFIVLGLAHAVWGQAGTTGTILGTVTDSTGSVIAGAPVEISNTSTGSTIKVTSTGTGDYTAPNLVPGLYKVSVQMAGFSKTVVSGIVLVVAQDARVNLQLKAGAVSETIEVMASAVALDTDSSSVSQIVSEKQMSQLPINGRNFTSLLFVGAGAVQTVGEQGQMRSNEGDAISINGSRPESNNYTLDGLTNTDTALNTPAVILSQDAIQEFKVQSATYSAEYGFSANQVNIVSKSGGNQYHGSAFEFLRNDYMNAIPHQSVSNTSNKASEWRDNQFGYVLDGPISIPKLYNGHDRTFFLANYEGRRAVLGGHTSGSAPTAAELSGDFSAIAADTANFPLAGTAACKAISSSGAQNCAPIDPLTGQPFPGNKIPSARFARMSQVTAKTIPTAATDTNGTLNWFASSNAITNTDQQTYRVDQNFQKYGQIFFRYTRANYASQNYATDSLAAQSNAGANIFSENSTSWTGAYTLALPHGFVNDFRFGKLEAQTIQGDSPASAADISALGLTGTFTNLPSYAAGYPNLAFGVSNAVSAGSPGNNPTTSDIPVWEYADSVVKQLGAHSFSFGMDYRSWVQKRNLATNFLGSYSYSSNQINLNGNNGTNGCPVGNAFCGTGNSYADYLLGYYSGASTFQPGPFSATGAAPGHLNQYVFKYYAPYFQDDWKVNSKLTLNLGLRADLRSVPYATNDQLFWLDPQNTAGGLCFADKDLLTDGIAPAGNGFYRYCGQHPTPQTKSPLAPRFGFAYRPADKYVVRGGYGVFFDSSETREMDNSGDQYPFLIRTSLTASAGSSLKSTNQLFAPMSAVAPVSVAANGGAFTAVILSENPVNPYVQQWTVSVEREMAKNTTLEVNYIGNKGTHLLERFNVNQPGAVPTNELTYCNANPSITIATGGTYNCSPHSRQPLQNFSSSNGFLDSKWIGYSSYNSGNVKLEHRASDGAVLLVYTWAKSLDSKSAAAGIGATNSYAGPMDSANPRLDYGRSDFNVGQRFVASYAYVLPVGRNKKFGGNINRVADLAVGGWEITGIGTYQKGFPFSVLANDANSLLGTANQRANIIGDPHAGSVKSSKQWFNTAAFAAPQGGTFGTSGRNILDEPGISNWDMGMVKNSNISERVKFELRLETFNTFNHAQFGVDGNSTGGPGTAAESNNITSGTFGAITSYRPARILQLGSKITF